MIKYGIPGHYIDVTELVVKLCGRNNEYIEIPKTEDGRSSLFGDPIWGKLKHILMNGIEILAEQDFYIPIKILCPHTGNFDKNEVAGSFNEQNALKKCPYPYIGNPHEKLKTIHSTLKFTGGVMTDEYPEQVMAISFINPDDRVLEIGSNIGRNSLIISSILSDSSNLTTIESDSNNIPTLTKNRDDNNFNFKIYNGALSRSKLWQRWWVTKPQETCPGQDWTRVNTFMLSQVNNNPTVLVADCEGALYYILQDFPEILDTVRTILVENDYRDVQHYLAVETIFKENGFDLYYNDYCHEAKQYNLPLYKNFFQVWKR
jgi:FkbM family methyltransferase